MIDIVCVRGLGDKEASEISDPLIPTEYIAVKRGTNFINENWYKRKERSIQVPFKDSTTVGAVASVYESHLNIVGNHVITSHSISISRDGAFSTVSIEQHEENT